MLYGKSRKYRLGDSVLRPEVRMLKRRQLDRQFRDGDWRDFACQWGVYRRAMLQIPKLSKPQPGGGFPEAIGRAIPVALHERVLSEMTHKRPRTISDYRRKMCIAAANLPVAFSWADYLPESGPPDTVAVESHEKLTHHEH